MSTGHSARVVRRRRQVAVALVAAVVVLASFLLVARLGGGDGDDLTTRAGEAPQAEGPSDHAGEDDDPADEPRVPREAPDRGSGGPADEAADDPAEPAENPAGPAENPADPADDPADDGAAPVVDPAQPPAGPAAEAHADAEAEAPAEPSPPADEATVLAGILAPGVPDVGSGDIEVVAGSAGPPAPQAKVVRVRVGVEGGLPVDGAAVASFVMATLNDGRSWVQDGYSFARTDGEADLEVVLASPQTSAAMCRPLVTNGTLSCRNGTKAIITHYRWVNGTDDYAADLTGYRQYVVNHEVGHFLGHGHVSCPAAGSPAPLMMQQTKGLGECTTNPWPYP